MFIISDRAKKCFRKFIACGGLTAFTAYVLEGDWGKAFLIALIFSTTLALDEYYFGKS